MTVSDKMVDVFKKQAHVYNNSHTFEYHHRNYTQRIINAAWTEFNPDDESTWPKTQKAPSGMKWQMWEERWKTMSWNEWHGLPIWRHVTRYADPQDLMFKEIK